MPVTRKDYDAAVAQAHRTGKPAPVKDSAGHIAYYVDQSGATVDAKNSTQQAADPTGDLRRQHPDYFGETPDGTPKIYRTQAAEEANQEKQQKGQQRTAAQSQSSRLAAANSGGIVWVNGQRMRVTAVDGQGNPTALAYDQPNGTQAKNPTQNGTVFNALNLSDIPNGAAQFLMSGNGLQMDGEGNEVGSYQGVQRMGRGDMTAGPTGRNMMTIENGLQWFANLSTKDKPAYSEMVKELQEAGYLPSSGATGTSQFGADAAHAIALAMRDLAVVNQTSGGANIDLETFLHSAKSTQQADAKAKAEAAYQPVNREYQDPASLAAAAKSAAQNAIGRALTPEEEKRFESEFHDKESSMYNAVDASGRAQAGAAAVGDSAAGATFYRPDTSGEADAYVNSAPFEQERAGVAIGKYGDILKQMVGL